jgi:hypothetical protein
VVDSLSTCLVILLKQSLSYLDPKGIGGNVQIVQNSLGSILDSIDIAVNVFNFTVSLLVHCSFP